MANPLGSAPSVILGVGLGAAASTAIEPIVEPARQQAWANNANRVLDPATYAALVAQGAVDLAFGGELAQREGFAADKFRSLVYLAQRAPTYGEAQDLRRRNKITDAQLRHSFAKAQIEAQYWDALADLVDDRLSPQNVAVAIVRGLMANPGILPVGPPAAVGKVPAFPVSKIDPVAESAASGFDKDRLAVLAGIFGRPLAPDAAAQSFFRGIIELADFQRAISEGDIRNEWADALLEHARQILSANNYAELELRGFYDTAKRRAKTAQHGLSDTDSDDLVNLLGRSIAVHQVTTGLARGGKYPGSYANVPEPFKSAIQRSNIRQEWAELDYANRYSLPSAFVFRALIQDGAITEAEGQQYFLEIGWPPELAASVAKAYAPAGGKETLDPFVKRAQTQLWTATHKAYVGGTIDEATADSYLTNLVPDAGGRAVVLELWTTEATIGSRSTPPAPPAA